MSLFRTKKDIDFVIRINRELIERVAGNKVTYYAISKKNSNFNIYGESKEKVVDPPVQVYALIEWQDQEVTTTQYGQDISYRISVFILNDYLSEIKLNPIEGDFIDYDGTKFEITEITEPTLIFGKAGYRIGKRMLAKSVRENTFKISISASEDISPRTAPDEKADNKSIYDNILWPYSGSQ